MQNILIYTGNARSQTWRYEHVMQNTGSVVSIPLPPPIRMP